MVGLVGRRDVHVYGLREYMAAEEAEHYELETERAFHA
jgi:hypothetical protein